MPSAAGLRILTASALVAAGAACGDGNPPLSSTPAQIDVADRVDFGPVTVGRAAERKLSVFSRGTDTLRISQIQITSEAATPAFVTDQTALDIIGGAADALVITFRPTSVGTHTATLTINSNAFTRESVQVKLQGVGADDASALTVRSSGGGVVLIDPNGIECRRECRQTYPNGATLTLTARADPDFVFGGFQGCDSSVDTRCTVNLQSDTTIDATFNRLQRNLQVKREGAGAGTITAAAASIDCGSDCDSEVDQGSTVVLTAVPDPTSSSFAGWRGCDAVDGATCTATISTDRTVTASFDLLPRSLSVQHLGRGSGTVTSNLSGIDCGATCTSTYAHGAMVRLTAVADPGFDLAAWGGCDTSNGPVCDLTMNAARTVTAAFGPMRHALTVQRAGIGSGTVTSTPGGIQCGADCNEAFEHGTVVNLTATPDASSVIRRWTGCDSTSGAVCTVTIDAARTVAVDFGPLLYDVTVNKSGAGTGRVTSVPAGIDCGSDCNEVFSPGASVALTAVADSGSLFSGWTGCDSVAGAVCTVNVNLSRQVTASFDLVPHRLTVVRVGTGSVRSSPPGILCGSSCAQDYGHGARVVLTATPDVGALFGSWSGCDVVTGVDCTITLNSDRTATAVFQPVPRQLTVQLTGQGQGTVTSSPAGINCGTDCNEAFGNGLSVNLTATASRSSAFNAWTGCDTTLGTTCVVRMSRDTTITASFDPVCGNIGEACCAGSTCTAPSSTCINGLCAECGGFGQPCCSGVCNVNLSCNSADTCTCGDRDEACCSGISCNSSLVCTAGTCQCGGVGQPCCPGSTCSSHLLCSRQRCGCVAACAGPPPFALFALKSDGTLWRWGATSLAPSAGFMPVAGFATATQVDFTGTSGCAVAGNGSAWCLGTNTYGQIGDGTTNDSRFAWVQVVTSAGGPPLTNVRQISRGGETTCAVTTANTVWCWGRGASGQLGNGGVLNSAVPVQVVTGAAGGAFTDVTQVSASDAHVCAVKTNGSLWCWGRNLDGEIGVGSTSGSFIYPTRVLVNGARSVDVAQGVSCATLTDDSVRCWGSNANARLGLGTTGGNQTTPASPLVSATASLTAVAEVKVGTEVTCARRQNGELWCWGNRLAQTFAAQYTRSNFAVTNVSDFCIDEIHPAYTVAGVLHDLNGPVFPLTCP